MKMLALVVRYYSKKLQIMTVYLGMMETPRATADKIYESFVGFINKVGLPLKKLLALGTDGGLNLCGIHQSLYALLKKKIVLI